MFPQLLRRLVHKLAPHLLEEALSLMEHRPLNVNVISVAIWLFWLSWKLHQQRVVLADVQTSNESTAQKE